MPLPLRFTPAGLPLWLVAGHGFTPDSPFEDTPMKVGENRKSRVYTTVPRICSVQTLMVERDKALTWNDWYENTLQGGALSFTAEVANLGPGRVFQAAEWLDPPQIVPMPKNMAMISGELLLYGPISGSRPSTGELAAEYLLTLNARSTATFPINLAQELTLALTTARLLSQEMLLELTTEARFLESETLDSDGNPQFIELEDSSGPIQLE